MTATTTAKPASQARLELDVDGMHCASCVSRIEDAVSQVEGVASAAVNLATGRASVEGASVNLAVERASVTYDPRETDLHELIAAVEGAGYSAREVAVEGRGEAAEE